MGISRNFDKNINIGELPLAGEVKMLLKNRAFCLQSITKVNFGIGLDSSSF